MFTSLDLLIVVFMIVAGLILVSLALMFLIKNKTVKRICFYAILALSAYLAYGGLRIGITGQFITQIVLGVLVILMGIAALVLERVFKNNDKYFLATRILSSVALVLGFANAFMI